MFRATRMRKFQKNAVKERRILINADEEIESFCNPPFNVGEHTTSSNAFVYVTPIVKFVVAIILP